MLRIRSAGLRLHQMKLTQSADILKNVMRQRDRRTILLNVVSLRKVSTVSSSVMIRLMTKEMSAAGRGRQSSYLLPLIHMKSGIPKSNPIRTQTEGTSIGSTAKTIFSTCVPCRKKRTSRSSFAKVSLMRSASYRAAGRRSALALPLTTSTWSRHLIR